MLIEVAVCGSTCHVCEGDREYTHRPIGWAVPEASEFGFNTNYLPCKECFPEEFKSALEFTFRCARQESLDRRLQGGNLSPKFRTKTFDSFEFYGDKENIRAQKEVVDMARSFCANWREVQNAGSWFSLTGKSGTGKNHVASAILREIADKEDASILSIGLIELVEQVKKAWRNTKLDPEVAMEAARKVDLLFLDELGVQYGTDAECVITYRVLDYRDQWNLPTITATNLPLRGGDKSIETLLGSRIADRMEDGSSGNRIALFNWPSYRRRKESFNEVF